MLLLKMYAENATLHLAIDKEDVTMLFNDAWNILKGQAGSLQFFVESAFVVAKYPLEQYGLGQRPPLSSACFARFFFVFGILRE